MLSDGIKDLEGRSRAPSGYGAPGDIIPHRLHTVGLPHISGYGGLGIKDMEAFSLAFRLRWEWFRWDEEDWPWKGAATSCDQSDMDLFAACTTLCWEW